MLRFAPAHIAAAAVICSLGLPVAAAAQTERERPLRRAIESAQLKPETVDTTPSVGALPRERRPSSLVPLYVTFGTLQVLDAHSTSRAIDRGAVEANPVMKGVAENGTAMLALKAGGTAGVIIASERMWKKNRKAAVIFMVMANSAMAWVVQHNYRVAR